MEKKILIVDDSSTIRQQVRNALVSAGFRVVEAGDGVEGLEVISSQADLAAVVCDVNMPRMGGLQMLELAKNQGQLDALPVIMLTTEGQSKLVQQAKALGAKGWIVKPFKAAQLVAAMQKLTGA